MPLALLLHKMIATLVTSARTLAPWTEIVALEATIVERARSAFLMHWFGRRLPLEGLSLRAHIVNMAELDAQFHAAQRSVPTSRGGPNLTEPLLGFAGTLAGMLLSPAGMIAGVSLLFRFSAFGLGVLLKALVWVATPFLLAYGLIAAPVGTSVLFGGGLLAAGGGFALAAALGDRREIRAVFDVFGSLARFMNASLVLLGQLAGPRTAVRNPLLKSLLHLGDLLAALVPQVLGAVAVLVTRIGTVLQPVARMLVGFGRLAGAVVDTLMSVVSGLTSEVADIRTGRLSVGAVLGTVVTFARHRMADVSNLASGQVDVLIEALTAVRGALVTKLDGFVGMAGDFLPRLFLEHPTVRILSAFGDQVAAIRAAFAAVPAKPSTGPGPLDPLVAALPTLPSLSPFPALPALPDAAALRRTLGGDSVPALDIASIEHAADDIGRASGDAPDLELGRAARAAVAREAHRPSVFGPELRALEDTAGPAGTAEALRLNDTQLERFRQAFGVVIGRILPPELRGTAIPTLVDPEQLPVLDLPVGDELRPVVRTLRLRMPGADLNDVKRFEDLVTDRLRRQTYLADGPVMTGSR